MKPSGDLMVDNRNAVNGNKIESEKQEQHKPRDNNYKRIFIQLLSRAESHKFKPGEP